MDRLGRIAGGIFVAVLMILTASSFNDDIQGLAMESDASEGIQAIALIFPYFWIGLIFIILGYTGYEVLNEIS